MEFAFPTIRTQPSIKYNYTLTTTNEEVTDGKIIYHHGKIPPPVVMEIKLMESVTITGNNTHPSQW